jgi:hypothetical protein
MKVLRDRRSLRQLQAVGLTVGLFTFLTFGHTLTALLWCGALAVALVPNWNRLRIVIPLWAAMLGSVLLLVDISFENRPGPPHFARLVMGLAIRSEMEKRYGTDVVMGGCMSTGLEPKWVLVW